MEYFENLSLLLSDYMGDDCPNRDTLLDIFGKVPIYSTIVFQQYLKLRTNFYVQVAINAYSVGRLGRGLYVG